MEPVTIFSGISAVASLVGGALGASEADAANRRAEKTEKKQQKLKGLGMCCRYQCVGD